MSVTDRYLHELRPLTLDQLQKESDPRLEHLLTGLRHLEIKVGYCAQEHKLYFNAYSGLAARTV